jgi:predicted DNA-binding transcriptional regulator AlpA
MVALQLDTTSDFSLSSGALRHVSVSVLPLTWSTTMPSDTEFLSKRWLTTAELPGYTGLSASLFEKLRAQGCGPPYVKIGRAVRYRAELVDCWMTKRSVTTHG